MDNTIEALKKTISAEWEKYKETCAEFDYNVFWRKAARDYAHELATKIKSSSSTLTNRFSTPHESELQQEKRQAKPAF